MAKKSLIAREKKRKNWKKNFIDSTISNKRNEQSSVVSESWEIQGKLEALPRNSAPTRLHRRCFATGRPRVIIDTLDYLDTPVREMVHQCLLPGATRSSW
ncbi:unnamed protein product [Lathyrus oleraceus]